jgi:hypothetical protein
MSGEKRFRGSFFGFRKSDVNLYIEKILKEFENKIKEKDEELAAIKIQHRDIKIKHEELLRNVDQVNEDREKIAGVLIKAQEKANSIIEEARIEAEDEKRKLEGLVENEKEKLVDLKAEVKVLRVEIINTLKKYEGQLDGIVDLENEA